MSKTKLFLAGVELKGLAIFRFWRHCDPDTSGEAIFRNDTLLKVIVC